MTEVSPLLVEKFKRWRADSTTPRGGHPQPGTINGELALLSRVLTMAVENGLIDSNPCSRVRRLRLPDPPERPLTRDEENLVLAEMYGHPAAIVRLAVGTAMRQGELCELEWARVEFDRGRVRVTNTKSGRDRFVPMSTAVRELLLGLYARRRGPFVFPSPRAADGSRPYSANSVRQAFRRACGRAGVAGVRFHDLRHTAATRMAEGGAHIVDMRDVLGHADIKQTARYAHGTAAGTRRAVESIQNGPAEVVRLEKKG